VLTILTTISLKWPLACLACIELVLAVLLRGVFGATTTRETILRVVVCAALGVWFVVILVVSNLNETALTAGAIVTTGVFLTFVGAAKSRRTS